MVIVAPLPGTKPIQFSALRHPKLIKFVPSRNLEITTLPHCTNVKRVDLLNNWRQNVACNKRVTPVVKAASISVPETGGEEGNFGKILLSDVVVKRRRNVYWGRQWSSMDVITVTVVGSMHVLSLFAPFVFNWAAFGVAFGLYLVTGLLGITLSFHRNLSHRAFKLPKWLEYLFAYCGAQALQVRIDT